MVLAYHAIFGAYGFWLPNDPRGSWSEFVGSWDLFRYGTATKTIETRSLAHIEHDRTQRLAAKKMLKYPPVEFTGIQARAIGLGFANYVQRSGLKIWACAIMPDHIHLVVGRFRLNIEKIVIQLKGDATAQLREEGIHPFGAIEKSKGRPPKCFGRGEWSVFLETIEDIQRAIKYVEDNPIKEGKKSQKWSFVAPFIPTFADTIF